MPKGNRDKTPVFALPVLGAFLWGLIALLIFALLTVAVCYIAWSSNHFTSDDDDEVKIEILTSNSDYNLTSTSFGSCQGGVTITSWRLHRVGESVTFSLIGDCLNASAASFYSIDFNFSQFPNPYHQPSLTGSAYNVVGTGSAIEDTNGTSAYVEVEGDNNEECIDLDLNFVNSIPEGANIPFSFMCQYEIDC